MRLTLRLTASMPDSLKTFECEPLKRMYATRTLPIKRRVVLCLFPVLLLTFGAFAAYAQDYTSIVVFGDSLSDTGNVSHLSEAKYGVRIPGPAADYTDGRFTDGFDTVPAAQKYFGVWIEQFANSLPSKPVIKNSLDGGTDYAYGFATTGKGTGVLTFGPEDSLSVNVNNIGQQITDYLATHPKINHKTLFVVWGGAIDVLHSTSTADVIRAAIQQTLNIQRLLDAGATQFIIPNLPPLGATPRLNGSPTTSIPATQLSVLYNDLLATGVTVLGDLYHRRHPALNRLDVFGLFNQIIASPAAFSLVDITDSAQGVFTVDPDTFLFWDSIHPTTRGHNILAHRASRLIDRDACRSRHEENCEAVAEGVGESLSR
jgi:outer membrane lipase/esterase